MIKNGQTKSVFHHVFSDHEITLQSWICSNKACRKSLCESVKSKIGSSMHIDLQKIQTELGAQFSYKKSATILGLFSKQQRSINNHQRILRMVKTIGEVADDLESTIPEKSKEDLIVQIDGADIPAIFKKEFVYF